MLKALKALKARIFQEQPSSGVVWRVIIRWFQRVFYPKMLEFDDKLYRISVQMGWGLKKHVTYIDS